MTGPAPSESGSPLDAVRDLFGEHLEALAGGVVSGEIPLPAGIINRLIARKLASAQLPITAAEVEPHDAESFTVHLRLRAPVPALKVAMRIDQQPQLPQDPRLGVHWTLKGLGPLALFAGPIASHFKALPPGLQLDGDRLIVDLHTVMRTQGFAEAVPFVSGLRVLSREGRFLIQFELRR